MRIAIDATAIPMHRTGAGNYIFNLVRTLAEVDLQNEYLVFAKPAHVAELAAAGAGDRSNMRLLARSFRSRPQRLLWEQVGLPGEARRLGVDVLHSPHYTMPLRKTTRSVVTFCDMTFYLLPELHSRLKRIFFRAMMRWSARHADGLIAISDSARADAMRVLHIPARGIVTTPLAAGSVFRPVPPAEVAATCARYHLVPGRFISYVGVLEPRKNVPVLIEAYARIAANYPDVPLVIVGKKGWMYDAIFARVQHLGLGERVRFLGHIPEDDLIALYSGTGAFVYPSRYEGFGLPVLEALQCGAPVITTNISAMPEIAGDAALLVAPDDVAGLAAALRCLLNDPALAADLRRRGPIQAAQFSWARCAQETLAVYRAVAQGSRS